ncbi:MAG: type II secretion system F family protein [Candidatus Omnitrophota bacterium]|jgi:type IV pilus assembly protein PilC
MSHFTFKAKKPTGEIYSSEKDAADRYELYKLLHEQGDEVVEFREKSAAGGLHLNMSLSIFDHIKTIDKINFARNLGAMLEAGLALSRALSVLQRQTKNKSWKGIITNIIADIDRGVTFADALNNHPKVFPPILIAMVHAGEQSGTLSDSLKVVATQMDSAYALDKRIRGSLMYPAVIVTAMVVIAILMFVFVMPTLLKTFTDLNVELPLTTRIVIGVSDLIQNQGPLMLAILLIFIGSFYWMLRQPKGKSILHAFFLKIPVIGVLVQEVNTARTARTLSSLISSGVDVVESVNITSTVVQNVHFRRVLEKAAISIKKGDLVSKTFNENTDLYPVFFAEMMSVGEETGKTGEMLLGVAHYYEDDVEQKTKDMSTIIEPFLILLIGAAVGFFAVSMIQPMYSLVNVI